MSKTAEIVEKAWRNGERKKVGNTRTDGISVFLFGNKIITKKDGFVFWTLAGWDTVTTRERLNSILDLGLHTEKGELLTERGFPVDSSQWYLLEQN